MTEENYRNIPLYINEVLTSLNAIDFLELISMNPTNKKKCETALRALHLSPDEVLHYIGNYNKHKKIVLIRAYHSIQEAIISFCFNLTKFGVLIAERAKKSLTIKEQQRHMRIIDEFLSSDKLSKAMAIQYQKKQPANNTTQTIRKKNNDSQVLEEYEITEDNHRYNDLFSILQKSLNDYLNDFKNN